MTRVFAGTRRTLALVVGGLLSLASTPMGQARQPIIDVHKHASWPGDDDAAERKALLADMDAEGIVLSLLHVNEPGDVEGWLRAAPGKFIGAASDAVLGVSAGAVLSLLSRNQGLARPHLARARNGGGNHRNPRRDAVRLHGGPP